jgi:NAD-dependent DNA ligase
LNIVICSSIVIEYAYGEVVMSKKTFLDKYSNDFANPRNLVAGLLNKKSISESLKDCDYIKYGAVGDFKTKKELLDTLNKGQKIKVPYTLCKISELTEDLLVNLFKEYSVEYEIDGIIIEVNDINTRNKLGRETSSNNPVWARAFKHESFEQSEESEVIGLSWNISKQGYLKPVIHIRPVKLDGVMVSNVTGNNARFIKEMGIGIGSVIIVKRSGMVIPKVVDVLVTVDFIMPTVDGIEVDWNESGAELVTLQETDAQRLNKIISFFSILETDNVSEGVITQLWDAGYTTIKDILNINKTDLEKLDRFGKRKATIVYNSIKKAVSNVELSKLQHATGIFTNLGSKKLVLLEQFVVKPSVDTVMEIEGFAEKSAQTYVDNYDVFFDFVKDLPVTIAEKKEVVLEGNDLEGKVFVFTGVRMKTEESMLLARGAKIGSSISKKTTYIVCKDVNSGSGKLVKAEKLGVGILSVEDFKDMFIN